MNSINLADYPRGFVVTGITYIEKKRFSFRYAADNWRYVFGINLYRGRVWGIREDGTRKLLKSVTN